MSAKLSRQMSFRKEFSSQMSNSVMATFLCPRRVVSSPKCALIVPNVGLTIGVAGLFFIVWHANAFLFREADIRRDAAVLAIEQVLPSVVNIATETVVEYHDWYDDLLRE